MERTPRVRLDAWYAVNEGTLRQLTADRNLGLAVDFLDVNKSLVRPRDCHTKDFPLALDYGSDYGPKQTGEIEDLLKFLPLFAEVDGVRILRVLLKHAPQCASPPMTRANYRGFDARWGTNCTHYDSKTVVNECNRDVSPAI